jgi:hypothetical protein
MDVTNANEFPEKVLAFKFSARWVLRSFMQSLETTSQIYYEYTKVSNDGRIETENFKTHLTSHLTDCSAAKFGCTGIIAIAQRC